MICQQLPFGILRLLALTTIASLVACNNDRPDQPVSPPPPASPSALTAEQACIAVTGKNNLVPIHPFQPASGDIAFIDRIYEKGSDGFNFTMYGNSQKTVLVDGIPFARYWQLENPDQYVFHPMVWGRFVFEQSPSESFAGNLAAMTDRVGSKLPGGGGTAFYYPNHYPLNRMSGPDLMYSAISQSEILAGYLRNETLHPGDQAHGMTESVKSALLYPHRDGGTNLADVAFLEMPLFRSNPEIILNGWLHALLHLDDYAKARNDAGASSTVEKHLAFFVDNHGAWYDNKRNISRYSDSSPHRIIINPESSGQKFIVVYDSVPGELGDYAYAPVEDPQRIYGGYDTRITGSRKDTITMGILCSGLFDSWLVSREPFSAKIRDGGYSPVKASPTGDGEWRSIQSIPVDPAKSEEPLHALKVALDEFELIRGYPTNFAKANKKNFYHGQHIVALKYLAKNATFDNPSLKRELSRIAESWFDRTSEFQDRGLEDFEPLQKVLDSINRGKLFTPATSIDQLGLGEWTG
ncbi:MAG: hypothetical protein P8J87_10040 [Verrucomicrobiales bacterium]|nr:hypothetical protein [Verrucomicrobiales bacterium]